MAYTPANHQAFSIRMQKFILNFQALREEAEKLDAIYVNETASGASENWIDTDIATAAEHVDGILLCQSLVAFVDEGAVAQTDRQQWLTPFLQ